MPDHRPRRRPAFWLGALATAVAAATIGAVVAGTPAQAALRDPATTANRFIGYAANAQLLCNNSSSCTSGGNATYRNLAATEFSQVTPENAMKWDAIEPSNNQYNYGPADGIVAFAQANNQKVHGHTLVWHSQTPGYVQSLGATAMRAEMQQHIAAVVGHYANNPTVGSWDVVNEAISDSGGTLRSSFWLNTLGESYIADAFTYARAADPDADLCINDYGIEGQNAKSNRLYQLVQSLLSQNVPITCVGFQSHLVINQIPSDFQANLQRFANLGLKVRITELDIRIPLPSDAQELQTQANNYATVVNVCRAVAACQGITTWGIDDGSSWLPNSCCGGGVEGDPLLWTSSYQQKPAYAAVNTAFGGGSTPPPSPTTPPPTTAPPTTAPPTTPPPTTAPPTTPPPTTTAPTGGGGCTATFTNTNQWPGGFQGDVTVRNTGSTTTSGWTVTVSFGNGQQITQLWNGSLSGSGPYAVSNLSWNGALAPNATTSFGFLGSWSTTNPAPTVSCTRTP